MVTLLTWLFWAAVCAVAALALLFVTILGVQWVYRREMSEDLGLRPPKELDRRD